MSQARSQARARWRQRVPTHPANHQAKLSASFAGDTFVDSTAQPKLGVVLGIERCKGRRAEKS
jgi:hypothetical protein